MRQDELNQKAHLGQHGAVVNTPVLACEYPRETPGFVESAVASSLRVGMWVVRLLLRMSCGVGRSIQTMLALERPMRPGTQREGPGPGSKTKQQCVLSSSRPGNLKHHDHLWGNCRSDVARASLDGFVGG